MNKKSISIKLLNVLIAVFMLISTTGFSPMNQLRISPPAVSLVSPSGAITTNQPVFAWQAPAFFWSAKYELKILMPNGGVWKELYSVKSLERNGSTLSISPDLVLPVGIYAWQVRYRLWRNITSEWSQTGIFEITQVNQVVAPPVPSPTVEPTLKSTPEPSIDRTTSVPTQVMEPSPTTPTDNPPPPAAISDTPGQQPDLLQIAQGMFDDQDTRLVYVGNWTSGSASGTYQGTLHTSNSIGGEVQMSVNGTWFVILFSGNSDRGVMDVFIDGQKAASINQYADSMMYQRSWKSNRLSAGTHSVILRHVSGNKVDFDGLFVEPPLPDPLPEIPAPTTNPASPTPEATVPGVNYAQGKPATQSSNFENIYGVGVASRANDGNNDGIYSNLTTTHTLEDAQAWWQVDLGSIQELSHVTVWNRTDCCSERLSDFFVLVSDEPFVSTALDTVLSQPGINAYFTAGEAGRSTNVNVNRTGRYVRVQLVGTGYLSLSEVEVWGASDGSSGPTPTSTPATPTSTPTPLPTTPTPTETSAPTTPAPTQPPASGAYYIATNGNDSNPGTIDRPWRTLAYASQRVRAGDTLYIRGGTYQEVTSWSADGRSDAPITVKNYPGETVVIDGYDTIPAYVGGTWMFMVWGDWYVVEGLEIKRSFDEGAIGVKGAHVTIRNCYTHHNWGAGITMMGDYGLAEGNRVWYNGVGNEFGARSRGGWPAALTCARYPDHCTLRGNTSWENWGEGISTFEAYYTTIEDNISYNNQQNLYVSDTKYTVVQRNLVYCTPGNVVDPYTTQNGILVGDEKRNPASSDNKIINNIVYGCDRNLAIGTNESTNNLVANNTFVNTDDEANILMYSGSCTNCRFMNNLIVQDDGRSIVINAGSGWSFSNNLWSKAPSTNANGANDIIGAPDLAKTGDPFSANWYKLLAGSPAINAGRSFSEIIHDFSFYGRTGNPDIGAFEFR